ncbi:hypothetical protein [Paraliomyxa miuraensis]|uniref:hypothetical protein n=1 Tax=Paraliomyxa miuraensis TaxID=376150 RepID=UPI00225829F8|nr:hypothetical protein [Paraliomyxa miuraensis]MCX4241011.1 hypothetical protein [Paraliomyxa miuraensis]
MGGRSRITAGLLVGSGLGLAGSLGCQPGGFACDSDLACEGLPDGQCEPSGYCSVPDEECDSGRRYSPHSGGLSGVCVGAIDTSTGPTTTSAEGGTSTQDGTTTDPDSSADGTSTGDPGPPRVACDGLLLVDDPFDALPLDPARWEIYETIGLALDVMGGELRLTATDANNAYTGIQSQVPLPPRGFGGAELVAVPPVDVTGEAYVVLTNDVAEYGFTIHGGMLHTFFDHIGVVHRIVIPHDPMEHRWLRLRFDQRRPGIYWEASPDGFDWAILDEEHALEAEFSLREAKIELGAGVWDGPVDADPLGSFGHAFVCEE